MTGSKNKPIEKLLKLVGGGAEGGDGDSGVLG